MKVIFYMILLLAITTPLVFAESHDHVGPDVAQVQDEVIDEPVRPESTITAELTNPSSNEFKFQINNLFGDVYFTIESLSTSEYNYRSESRSFVDGIGVVTLTIPIYLDSGEYRITATDEHGSSASIVVTIIKPISLILLAPNEHHDKVNYPLIIVNAIGDVDIKGSYFYGDSTDITNGVWFQNEDTTDGYLEFDYLIQKAEFTKDYTITVTDSENNSDYVNFLVPALYEPIQLTIYPGDVRDDSVDYVLKVDNAWKDVIFDIDYNDGTASDIFDGTTVNGTLQHDLTIFKDMTSKIITVKVTDSAGKSIERRIAINSLEVKLPSDLEIAEALAAETYVTNPEPAPLVQPISVDVSGFTDRGDGGYYQFTISNAIGYVDFDALYPDGTTLHDFSAIAPTDKSGQYKWYVEKTLTDVTYTITIQDKSGNDPLVYYIVPDTSVELIDYNDWLQDKLVQNIPIGEELPVNEVKSSSAKKTDRISPTLGLDKYGNRIVDNGFSFNGNYVNVEDSHTEYPLISTDIGINNTMTFKIYENWGIKKIYSANIGLGVEKRGQENSRWEMSNLSDAEVNLQINFISGKVTNLSIHDKHNLIQNFNAVSEPAFCKANDEKQLCVEVTAHFTYRESPKSNAVLINVSDTKHNDKNHYFNDGILVNGESMNPINTVIVSGIDYIQIDRKNNLWVDSNDIIYKQNKFDAMDRITPIPTFRDSYITLSELELSIMLEHQRAQKTLDELYKVWYPSIS